jgi:hypothetical protein
MSDDVQRSLAEKVREAVAAAERPAPEVDAVAIRAVVNDEFKARSAEIKQGFAESIKAAVASLPQPLQGERGEKGEDGKSVTVADIAPLIESMHAKWELDFERRAMDFHQRMLDRLPKPKDGKDGRDAIPVEDFDLSLDGRSLTVSVGPVSKTLHVPSVLYRGVFRDGETYEVGDLATFGGSLWHCNEPTTEKPETGKAWTLAAKRGRDGKDGKPGEKGDPGRNGKDGQDLIRPRGAWE